MKRPLLAACFLSLTACMPKNGRLEVNRFQHAEFPYAVFYTPEGDPLTPLGKSWRTDNFFSDAHGRYRPKQGDAWEISRTYDVDGDGKRETPVREFAYDLLLNHEEKDAAMWVSTFPIAEDEREQGLEVWAQRHVDAASGAGTIAVSLGEGTSAAQTRRYATRILHRQPCTVSKREALQVDFEIANTELAGAPDTRWRRGRVVLVRTGYERSITATPSGAAVQAPYPVIMSLGLSARPEDFSPLEPDFDTLLKRTVLGDRGQGLSMNGESTCGSLASAQSAGGEAPRTEAPVVEQNEAAPIPRAPEALPQSAGTSP